MKFSDKNFTTTFFLEAFKILGVKHLFNCSVIFPKVGNCNCNCAFLICQDCSFKSGLLTAVLRAYGKTPERKGVDKLLTALSKGATILASH